MSEQNQEFLLQALRNITKIKLEISKAGEFLWQVSLTLPEIVEEKETSSTLTADSSESNVTLSQNNLINSPDEDSGRELSALSDTETLDTVQQSTSSIKNSQSNPIDLPNSESVNKLSNSYVTKLPNVPPKISNKGKIRQYDVFLSYKTENRNLVEDIGNNLSRNWNLHCWFDEWCLGNNSVFDEIEKQAMQVKSVAIFIGKTGIGSFQDKEVKIFLAAKDRRGAKRPLSIIPVILIGGDKTKIPLFIADYKWVDFNNKEYSLAIEELFWRIKGKTPFKPSEFLENL